MKEMQEKLSHLKLILSDMGSVLVAYSGGVDSAFLAKVAHEVLGERAVAATALSPSYPSYEREALTRVAGEIGIRHVPVATQELENPSYRANAGDRCYFCKSELYAILRPLAERLGLHEIVNGTNRDDLGDSRPGLRAADEGKIRSPLVEAGLTKGEIRDLSRHLGLTVADKPALACLSSRIPVGTEVTPERLSRIDRIESGMARLGFKVFRLRFHEPIARIELGEDEIPRLADPTIRQEIARLCHQNGFTYATIDLDGYRYGNVSGSKL